MCVIIFDYFNANRWLDKNFLTELPDEFTQLENLIAIYLNGNALTSIPASKYVGLKWLNLDWNSLDCARMSKSANFSVFVKGKCNPAKQRGDFGDESSSSSEEGKESTLEGPIIALIVLCISWVIGAVVLIVTCVKSKKRTPLKNDLEANLIQQNIN